MDMNLDAVFAALADPTRRAILGILAKGEATVQQLVKPFRMSQPAISRHLKVLEGAGLIDTNTQGTSRPRKIRGEALAQVAQWLEEYRQIWEHNFKQLDELLAETANQDDSAGNKKD